METDDDTDPSFSTVDTELGPSDTFSFTFEDEGSYNYFCRFHADQMTGTVTVQSGAADSGQVDVDLENIAFSPEDITIAPRTEVTWTNRDDVDHTVTSGTP